MAQKPKIKVKADTNNSADKKSKSDTKAKTSTIVKSNASVKKKKKNANLAKLCSEMSKIVIDAVDKEVTKRFKTMIDSYEDDITKVSLTAIIKDPKNVDLNSYSKSLQPYIKHYIFMAKRNTK